MKTNKNNRQVFFTLFIAFQLLMTSSLFAFSGNGNIEDSDCSFSVEILNLDENCDHSNLELAIIGGTQPYEITSSWLDSYVEDELLQGGIYYVTVTGFVEGPHSVTVSDSGACGDEMVSFTMHGAPSFTASLALESLSGCDPCAYTGTVTVVSNGGCIDSTLISNLPCTAQFDPVCGCNGVTYSNSCVAIVTGGVSSYTQGPCSGPPGPVGSAYFVSAYWPNGETALTVENICPGDVLDQGVNITVSGGANSPCQVTITNVTISVPAQMGLFLQSVNASCSDVADGSIEVLIFDGVPPYEYVWSTGDTTATIENVLPGDYSVMVTDASGCVVSNLAYVSSPDPIEIDMLTIENETPMGAANGSITIGVDGGTEPYVFDWVEDGTTFSTDQNIMNLAAGTYQCFITDSNNCIFESDSIVVASAVSASSIGREEQLKLYPNPANDFLYLSWEEEQMSPLSLGVFNANGKVIANYTNQQLDKIKTTSWPTGFYLIRVAVKDEVYWRKVLIQH